MIGSGAEVAHKELSTVPTRQANVIMRPIFAHGSPEKTTKDVIQEWAGKLIHSMRIKSAPCYRHFEANPGSKAALIPAGCDGFHVILGGCVIERATVQQTRRNQRLMYVE